MTTRAKLRVRLVTQLSASDSSGSFGPGRGPCRLEKDRLSAHVRDAAAPTVHAADRVPDGYHPGTATTNRVLLMLHAIPPAGDDTAAIALLEC
jgi:hypothetical protein